MHRSLYVNSLVLAVTLLPAAASALSLREVVCEFTGERLHVEVSGPTADVGFLSIENEDGESFVAEVALHPEAEGAAARLPSVDDLCRLGFILPAPRPGDSPDGGALSFIARRRGLRTLQGPASCLRGASGLSGVGLTLEASKTVVTDEVGDHLDPASPEPMRLGDSTLIAESDEPTPSPADEAPTGLDREASGRGGCASTALPLSEPGPVLLMLSVMLCFTRPRAAGFDRSRGSR